MAQTQTRPDPVTDTTPGARFAEALRRVFDGKKAAAHARFQRRPVAFIMKLEADADRAITDIGVALDSILQDMEARND